MLSDEFKTADKSALQADAFKYLFSDLLRDNLRGNNKKRTLTGMDMESAAPTNFVPTMIYTFLYTANLKEELKGEEFTDCVPLILCFNAVNTVTGLNFNMIPNNVRASIIDFMVETDDGAYSGGGGFRVNGNLARLFLSDGGRLAFLEGVRHRTGLDVSGACRTYDRRFIRNARMIEYDMWKYIPYLCFNDAVRGGRLAAIQAGMITANRPVR